MIQEQTEQETLVDDAERREAYIKRLRDGVDIACERIRRAERIGPDDLAFVVGGRPSRVQELEQQVADLTQERDTQGADFARQFQTMAKERDTANQRYDLIERDLCSYIDAAREAESQLADMRSPERLRLGEALIKGLQARADAADAALVKMREQVDVWRSRAHQLRTTAPVSAFDEQQADAYEVCADEVSALIDGHTEEAGEAAGSRLAAAEAQLVTMREQLRKLPRYWSRVATTPQVRSVPSVLWVDVERVLSALLDPQDQP